MMAENQPEITSSLANIIDIWTSMQKDFERKYSAPLASVKTDCNIIRQIAVDYGNEKFRAMWNYYLSVCWNKGYAVSIENFLKPENLNKYAGMVRHIGRKGAELQSHSQSYTCEYGHDYREFIRSYSDQIKVEEADEYYASLPEVHDMPCPICGGRCYRDRKNDYEFFFVGKPWDEYEGTPEHDRIIKQIDEMKGTHRDALRMWKEKVESQHKEIEKIRRSTSGNKDAETERAKAKAVRGLQPADGDRPRSDAEMRPLSQIAPEAVHEIVDASLEDIDELNLDDDIDFF